MKGLVVDGGNSERAVQTPTVKGDAMTATARDRETARGIAHRLNGLSGPALEDAIAAALTAARQEEREACAKAVKQAADHRWAVGSICHSQMLALAAAIRAGGTP
jgi:hypothetical protein